jgi:hypothetical protein
MKNLSIAQEYLLCSLNKKGKLPSLSTEIPVCVLASGLIELLASKCIKADEKNYVSVIGDLSGEQVYLKSLYDSLNISKPMKIRKIAEEYIIGLTGRKMTGLVTDIGNSLADKSCVKAEKGGIFGNKDCFIPDTNEVDKVIQKIRAELLESGTMSDETAALVSLLDKSNQIKKYFSKYESEQLKIRLNEIKNTPSDQLVKQMIDYIEEIIAIIAAISATH